MRHIFYWRRMLYLTIFWNIITTHEILGSFMRTLWRWRQNLVWPNRLESVLSNTNIILLVRLDAAYGLRIKTPRTWNTCSSTIILWNYKLMSSLLQLRSKTFLSYYDNLWKKFKVSNWAISKIWPWNIRLHAYSCRYSEVRTLRGCSRNSAKVFPKNTS